MSDERRHRLPWRLVWPFRWPVARCRCPVHSVTGIGSVLWNESASEIHTVMNDTILRYGKITVGDYSSTQGAVESERTWRDWHGGISSDETELPTECD